jgi:hypothetical protein
MIIVSFFSPKVRTYTRYRYIYIDLYRLMLTYLTYADHMLEIVKFCWKFPKLQGNFSPKPSVQRYLGVLLVKKGKIDIVISSFDCRIRSFRNHDIVVKIFEGVLRLY